MQEVLVLVITYVRIVWRYRWLALMTAGGLSAAGWVWVMLLPDQYEVETRVYLDTQSLLRPILKGLAIDTDAQSNTAQLMRRTLLVRPNLEAVARKTDMDLKAKTPQDFERLLDGLANQIKVSGTSRDNIFVIAYQNSDPKLATRVVEAILNLFVERSLGESRKDTSKTKQFIERQIAEYEARLDTAEQRLKEFKQRNFELLPGSSGDYYQRLETANGTLGATQQALKEAKSKLAAIEAQLQGDEPVFGLAPPPPPAPVARAQVPTNSPFDGRISELQRHIDQLLLQFTERHPDVIQGKRLLESLEKQRVDWLEEARRNAPPPPQVTPQTTSLAENPVFQELKLLQGQLQGEVAVLEDRVTLHQSQVQELETQVDQIFKVEAELKRLNRDYDINKRNYEELVKRREALKLGEEAGQSTDDVQFNVIEPPREPLLPVGPNRELLSSGVFVGALGAGIGLALLLGMLRPMVYSRDMLRDLSDLPILGTVSRLWTPRERFRRRLEVVTFAVGCLGLVGLFAGLVVLYRLNINIAGKLAQLGQQFL
ncbi:MAG: chain-length determining protein [Ectothiorhodospiraceae bacterium]|nr:chain-length determining protein [Chromatiales bacterium]MCP5157213.1 chain-length determining protein [Ectothiorhodospiraceae bacterium]